MDPSFVGANIVILAKNHNPSIVSKEWLAQNKIIKEEVLNFSHLPIVSVIETKNFNLVVDQDRLQLSIKEFTIDNLKSLPKIISEYINKLPETPYKALGFNYSYRIEMDAKKLKDVLLTNETRLIKVFSEGYKFGGIISFSFGDFAVKLTIVPMNDKEIGADFNFHFDTDKGDEIIQKLFEHPDTKGKADDILGGLFNVQ